jgi:hypothetical protein
MKVMVLVKATPRSEAGMMPSEEIIAAMGRFKEVLVKARVLLGGDGLHPSRRGKRLHIAGGKRSLVDGPFAETKELVGGYWIWQVQSLDEAVEWANRCADYMQGLDCVLELRPILEEDDFGGAFTPELRAQDRRLRAEVERQRKE